MSMAPRAVIGATIVFILGIVAVATWYSLTERVQGADSTAGSQTRVASDTHPTWAELDNSQKAALEPLAEHWGDLDRPRKLKWLEIAATFPNLSADARERSQQRMHEWVRLTPEQRRLARDTFSRVQTLPPDKRAALLERYEKLPEDKKRALVREAQARKPLTPVVPPSRLAATPPPPNKDQILAGATYPLPTVAPFAPVTPPSLPAAAAPAAQTAPSIEEPAAPESSGLTAGESGQPVTVGEPLPQEAITP